MTFSNLLDFVWLFARVLFGAGLLVFVFVILANVWKKDKEEDKDPEKDL
jgi:hypothetical protein